MKSSGADASTEVGRSALRPLLTATITGWFLFATLAALGGDRPRTLLVDLATALLTLLAREVIARRPRWTRVAVHFTCTINLLGLVVTSWLAGGASGVGWTLLPAVPLFAAHVEGRRIGWIWCGITLVGCVVATSFDFSELDAPPTAVHHVIGGLWLIVICTSFAVLARREVEAHMVKVEAAAKARSDLVAAISHDVRTPLHAVLGITTVLSETDLDADQRDLVERLAGTGKSLQRIVDDVLDTAQLEAGRFTVVPKPIDLLEVLEDVVDLYTPDATAKGIALSLRPSGGDAFRVIGDDTRLKQVLSNVVANAVKFTTTGSVVVRARSLEEGAKRRIEIRVEDTGPGIPADRLDRLFSRFDRLDTTAARTRAGTGLGLALSWDLARLMGGTLDVDRTRTSGAAFVLELLLDPHPIPIAIGELGGVVLVLEASEARADAARALGESFTTYTLVVASSVEQAIGECASHSPDVVIVHAAVPDLLATRQRLAAALGTRAPIVLAREPTGVAIERRVVAAFAGTTLLPLRRSRLARLLDEVMRSGARPALTHGTALVVDDDATNRKILEHIVVHRGWSVVTAPTAHEALARLRDRTFDVVLCDLNMPDIGGIELHAAAMKEGHRSYWVAATASSRPEDRERCLAAGFDAFLNKPLRLGEIDAILGRHGTSAVAPRAQSIAARAPATASSVSAPSALPDVALFDEARWEQGRALMGAEHDDVVREHLGAARAHVDAMHARVDDAVEVERRAHALSSGALGLGLAALGLAARSIEQTSRALSLQERRAAVQRLTALLDASKEAVRVRRDHVGPAGRGSSSVPGSSSVRGAIVDMRVVGRLRRDMLAQRIAAVVRASPEGPLAVLADLTRMTEYEVGVPEELIDWLLVNRERLVGFAFVSPEPMLRSAADNRARMTGLPLAAFEDVSVARAWLDARQAEHDRDSASTT